MCRWSEAIHIGAQAHPTNTQKSTTPLCGAISVTTIDQTTDIMKSRGTVLLISLTVGVFLTLILTGLAFYLYRAGAHYLANILFWPNTLLQSLVPCYNISTRENPVCEGTPVNILAYGASFPLSITVYSSLAYVFIRRRKAP